MRSVVGTARKSGKRVRAQGCVVCGAPAVVRIRDQHYCGTCALEYQRVRQHAHERGIPLAPQEGR